MANRTNTLINIHGVDSQWHICMWMKILRRITDCHQIDATYEGFFLQEMGQDTKVSQTYQEDLNKI